MGWLFSALISQKGPCDDVKHTTFPNNDRDLIIKRKYFPILLFQTDKANRKYSATLFPVFYHPFHYFLPMSILGENCLRKLILQKFRFHLRRQLEPSLSHWLLPPPTLMVEERAGAKGGLKQECSQYLLLLVIVFPSF